MYRKICIYLLSFLTPLLLVAVSHAWTITTCAAATTAPHALTWNVTVAANRYWKFQVNEYWTDPNGTNQNAYRWSTGGAAHPTIVIHSGTVNRVTVTTLSYGPGHSDCKGHLFDGGPSGPPPTSWTLKASTAMWQW